MKGTKGMEHPSDLDAAFKIIKQYDPDTYAAMVAADWEVTDDEWTSFRLMLAGAFGGTKGNPHGHSESGIALDQIQDWAKRHDVPCDMFAAFVLVHEFAHHLQGDGDTDESNAYHVGDVFADKLPAPYGKKMRDMADDTYRENYVDTSA